MKFGYPVQASPYFIFKNLWKLKNVTVDGGTFIGRDVTISEGVCFYGKSEVFGKVQIGRYSSINGPSTRICSAVHHVYIGSFCSIASNVIIQEYNHAINLPTTYNIFSHIFNDNQTSDSIVSKGPIIIDDDVWIGSNSVVLSGVHIGKGSVIGAGTVVSKNIPPYSVVIGNPCKIIRKRFSDEIIQKLDQSNWTNWSIEEIKRNKDFFQIKY